MFEFLLVPRVLLVCGECLESPPALTSAQSGYKAPLLGACLSFHALAAAAFRSLRQDHGYFV